MVKCSRCGKQIHDGQRIFMKCPATFEQFTPTVHRAAPEDVEEIWHESCDDEED